MSCRACFGENLIDFVDLGLQPLSNDYRKNPEDSQTFYPLKVVVCESCGLGQLSETVSPMAIFKDYMYFSSQSPTWVADRRSFARRMINELYLGASDMVIDIGSNDGYFLRHFQGITDILGYEPADNVVEVALQNDIPTRSEFWGRGGYDGKARLINATNVLAHTPDMDGFIAGIARSLAPNGTATLEFPLFSNLIKYNQLDTIYHEHYSYISIGALQKVLERDGLRIWRIEELPTHGGSVRVFACQTNARFLEEESVARVKASECWAPDTDYFEEKARRVKQDLLQFLIGRPPIIGYGAPAKATVLCNYAGLNADMVDFVVDDSPYKQGKFIPGTNIPIKPFSALDDCEQPPFIFVFAWNLVEPIAEKLRTYYGSLSIISSMPQIVTAIPELQITNL